MFELIHLIAIVDLGFQSETTSKSHSTSSGAGYRRAQGTKIEKQRCTSDRLREIIEDVSKEMQL